MEKNLRLEMLLTFFPQKVFCCYIYVSQLSDVILSIAVIIGQAAFLQRRDLSVFWISHHTMKT